MVLEYLSMADLHTQQYAPGTKLCLNVLENRHIVEIQNGFFLSTISPPMISRGFCVCLSFPASSQY